VPEAPLFDDCHAALEAPPTVVSADFAQAEPGPTSAATLLVVLEVHLFPTPSLLVCVGAGGVIARGGGGGGGGLGDDIGLECCSYPVRPRSELVAILTGGGIVGGGAFMGSFTNGCAFIIGGGAFIGSFTKGSGFAVGCADPEGTCGGLFRVGGDRERLSTCTGRTGGGAFAGTEFPPGGPLPIAEPAPDRVGAAVVLGPPHGPSPYPDAFGALAEDCAAPSAAAMPVNRGTFGVRWWKVGTAAVILGSSNALS